MLLEELDKRAAEREAELRLLKDEGFFDVLGGWAQSIGELWLDTFIATPKIPGQIVDALGTFQKRRGDRPLWIFFASVLASIAGGLAAGKLAGRLVRRHEERVFQAQPRSLGHWIKLLALRFFLQSVRLMAFTAVGLLINRLINKGVPPDLMTGRFLVEESAYTILAGMVAGFVLGAIRTSLAENRHGHRDGELADRAIVRRDRPSAKPVAGSPKHDHDRNLGFAHVRGGFASLGSCDLARRSGR